MNRKWFHLSAAFTRRILTGALKIDGREMSIGRNQYVLDMSRADVRDYLFGCIADILSGANIEYVKWDFNRNLTEAGSCPSACGKAEGDLPPVCAWPV